MNNCEKFLSMKGNGDLLFEDIVHGAIRPSQVFSYKEILAMYNDGSVLFSDVLVLPINFAYRFIKNESKQDLIIVDEDYNTIRNDRANSIFFSVIDILFSFNNSVNEGLTLLTKEEYNRIELDRLKDVTNDEINQVAEDIIEDMGEKLMDRVDSEQVNKKSVINKVNEITKNLDNVKDTDIFIENEAVYDEVYIITINELVNSIERLNQLPNSDVVTNVMSTVSLEIENVYLSLIERLAGEERARVMKLIEDGKKLIENN